MQLKEALNAYSKDKTVIIKRDNTAPLKVLNTQDLRLIPSYQEAEVEKFEILNKDEIVFYIKKIVQDTNTTTNDSECYSLYCSCGCNDGVLLNAEKDEFSNDCFLSLVSDNYSLMQKTGWHHFKEKCKRIWKIIKNEEYRYFNICIDENEMKEFKEFVAKL